MKFFTKEWYELCQKTSAHLLLEEDNKADVFSEEYFQQLYNQKVTELLNSEEEVFVLESSRESNITPESFDRNSLCRNINQSFLYNLEHIQKILPHEILTQIADLRAFVLNKASNQVIKAVTQYCENNRNLVERTMKEYYSYYKKMAESFDKYITDNINFHDSFVIGIIQTEDCFSILFDDKSGGFTNKDKITFKNYRIIKQDSLLENSWWLYQEIYKTNEQYEFHVLLQNQDMELIEFVILTEHISFDTILD